MPKPTLADLTLADLAVSPLNVRFNEKDSNRVETLSVSIVELGLLEQLLIHPAPENAAWAKRAPGDAETYGQDRPASFGVLAGGRRYRAIRLAVKEGRLPKDFRIRCAQRALSDAQIVLLSLSENLHRADLQAYEEAAAIAKLRALGLTVDQIAHELGQEPAWVRRLAQLGALHPPIFDAWVRGALSIDQARAFAATSDPELQEAAWAHFHNCAAFDRRPEEIRAFYKVGNHQIGKLLRFVSEEAYCTAGGAFELDLFATDAEHRGRVADEDLLHKLVQIQMTRIRAGIREQAGWRDLAFVAEPPLRHGVPDGALEIFLDKPADLAEAVPEGTPDSAIVVTLEIASTGKAIHRFWWKSRQAKAEAEGQGKPAPKGAPLEQVFGADGGVAEGEALCGPFFNQRANQVARDEHGLTASGVEVILSQRRDILRAVLCLDAEMGGNLARDYLIFGELRAKLNGEFKTQVGLLTIPRSWRNGEDEPASDVSAWCDEQTAGGEWKLALERLIAADFMVIEDPCAAFRAFLAAGEDAKARAAAVLVGLILVRSANLDGYRLPLHDLLAEIAGLDALQVRRLWAPLPGFCGLFPKLKRMELAQPFVEPAALAKWASLKDKPLSAATAQVLTEQRAWVHPAISFDFDGFEAELEPAAMEAAR